MRFLSSFLGVLFFLSLIPFAVKSADVLDVVINEIAWMGTKNSPSDEWIEIYNNSGSQIDLAGWKLTSQDGAPEINLIGIIAGNDYFLLERTDDNTLPTMPADQIYSGTLGNEGETLNLYDSSRSLIDSVNCSEGWFSGDNQAKQTMERKNPLLQASQENWEKSQNPGGTPNAKNIFVEKSRTEEGFLSTSTENTADFPENQINYPINVFINEILPSPEGADEKDEWIELFNQNNFEIDLSGWKIKDLAGKCITYVFPEETKIIPQGFLILRRPLTKIVLNNDADVVSLIQPDGQIADSVSYEAALLNQSYNKIRGEWIWGETLTPGSINISPSSTIEPEENKIPKEDNKTKNGTAAIVEQIQNSLTLPSFFLPLALAVFSGIIILILKRKLKTS